MIMSIKIAAVEREEFVQALEDLIQDIKTKKEGSNFFSGYTPNRPYEMDFDVTEGENVFEESDLLSYLPDSTYVGLIE